MKTHNAEQSFRSAFIHFTKTAIRSHTDNTLIIKKAHNEYRWALHKENTKTNGPSIHFHYTFFTKRSGFLTDVLKHREQIL